MISKATGVKSPVRGKASRPIKGKPMGKSPGKRSGPRGGESASDELREKIILVAKKHFATHGLGGASLKDIAREAKVAGSLINYHFESKAGLFKICVESFAKRRMEAITRILGEVRNHDELRVRIELFVGEMLASIVDDPNGFEILDREIRSGQPMALKIFEETLLVAFKSVIAFFEQAQSRGLMEAKLEPIIVASLLFSSTCDAARKDVLAKRFFNVSFENSDWRKAFTEHVVTLFMSGVMK